MEVVVGTYDPLLLGFQLVKNSDSENSFRFEPKFVDKGHAGCVKSVVCDEGGSILASGSTDETIRLYSLKDRRELGSLHQHEGSVTCLTFCGNTHMLSASEDKTICVYSCKTWECLKVLKGHKSTVNSISVHPSGRLAMSVSKDKHLRTWNLVSGRSAYVTHIKEDATLIKWSPSGDCYALVIGNKIVLYKLATASLSCTMELPRPVLAMQFLTEKYLVAAGEFDGIRVFDIEKEACVQTISGHESRVKALEVVHDPFPDEDSHTLIVFSVSSDGDLRAWSLNRENFEEEANLIARYEMNGRPTCLTVSYPRKRSLIKKQHTTEETVKKEKQREANDEQRTRRASGDEPTTKKVKKKKKGSSKKKKRAEGETHLHGDKASDAHGNDEEDDMEEF